MLQGQIETLQQKKVEVDQHIEQTEAWVEHLGKWSVHVHVEEDEDMALIATMIVHVPNNAAVCIFFCLFRPVANDKNSCTDHSLKRNITTTSESRGINKFVACVRS